MLSASQIDLIVYDFDGVMTNNLVLVSQEGSESVFCSRGDGLGVSKIKSLGIEQVIITEGGTKYIGRCKNRDLEYLGIVF